MRLKSLAPLLLVIAACPAQPLQAAPTDIAATAEQADRAIADLVARHIEADEPGVAIAVSHHGERVFSRGFGIADLQHNVPITPQTRFEAASISKQFTAIAILLLAQQGALSLDDGVAAHLPELGAQAEAVSIRHLLMHTGGFRDISTLSGMAGWRVEDARTDEQMLALLSLQHAGNSAPDGEYQYSNSGYFVLARIVERVSGVPFEDFVEQRIFAPLGMADSQFRRGLGRPVTSLADSYRPAGDDFLRANLNSAITGSTGLITTTEDLLRWSANFADPVVGNAETIAMMRDIRMMADGGEAVHAMGQERREYNGMVTWAHGGRDGGYRAFLIRIPERDFTVAVLSNRSDFLMANIAFDIVDIYFPESVREAAPWVPADERLLARYAGDYELFPGLIFSLRAEDDQLLFSVLGQGEGIALPQQGAHRFTLNPAQDISIEFRLDEEGPAPSLRYHLGMNGWIEAPRIELEPFDAASVDPTDYAGRYYSEELGTEYRLSFDGERLVADHLRLAAFGIAPFQPDLFSTTSADIQEMRFVRDENGRVVGCYVSGAVAEGVYFERRD